MILDYFDGMVNAVDFLIALGSIIGLLGLIVGILGWLFLGQFGKRRMAIVIIVSFILLTVCGLHTGLVYFGVETGF
jgi:hypothetical protein